MIRAMSIHVVSVVLLLGGFFLFGEQAFAEGSPLDGTSADPQGNFVTCNGPECNYCDVLELVERVIRWLVLLLTIIGTLLFVYAGLLLSSSQGDVGKRKKAKDMLLSVVIGFIIVLSSWMIIDVIMKAFVDGDVGVWNSVSEGCGGQYSSAQAHTFITQADAPMYASLLGHIWQDR